MRFQTRAAPPNYLGRREQRRLLITICLLGLVLLLMREAGKPRNWAWFVALNNPAQQPAAEPANIDTRLKPAEGPVVAGEFHSPPEKSEETGKPSEFFTGVQGELLDTVRDDTVFRGAEHDAFFHLLEILHDTDQRTLQKASRGNTAFVQLYQQPEEYRGSLVTVSGTVRGVFKLPASRNDYGIVDYFQVWIQPYDNPNFPLVVYVLTLPEGFPVADRVQEEVELTGFFFKRWAYRAQDAIRSAPLLVAKTLEWNRPAAPAETAPMELAYAVGIVTCALMAAGVVVWMALRSGTPYKGPVPPQRIASPESEGESDPSPEAALKRLTEEDSNAAAVSTSSTTS